MIVEVIPGPLNTASFPNITKLSLGPNDKREQANEQQDLEDGDDVLEIPILVRVEWETEVAGESGTAVAAGPGVKLPKEAKELAFWSVLGAGRIVQ